MNRKTKIFAFICLIGIYACSPSVGGKVVSAQSKKPFYQDLKPLRKNLKAEKKNQNNDLLKEVTDQDDTLDIKKMNKDSVLNAYKEDSTLLYNSLDEQINMAKNKTYWQGFAVEAYKGNSRSQANEVKSMIYKHDIKLRPKIEYTVPYYRVMVGQFDEKQHAYPLYFALKKMKRLQRISETKIVPAKIKN